MRSSYKDSGPEEARVKTKTKKLTGKLMKEINLHIQEDLIEN